MAINEVNWYLPDHVLYIKQMGIVDYDVLHHNSQRIVALASQSPASIIYTLVDGEGVTSSPFDLEYAYRQLVAYARTPKIGTTIYIGKYNRIRKLAIVMFYKLVDSPVEFADTIEDALTVLIRLSPSLKPLLEAHLSLSISEA